MMKRILSHKRILAVAGVFALVVFASACNKNDDDNYVPTPTAGLMTFNMVTDQPGVSVALSDNLLPGGVLPYTSYSGSYINIIPGNRRVASYSSSNTPLDSMTYNFEANKYYSLFVMGANGHYKNVLAMDNYDSLTASSGKAYVRYVNAIPDSSSSQLTIKSGSNNVVNSPVMYRQFSQFMAVDPGQLNVMLSNNSTINATRDITVNQQKAYTILLLGMPGATDSDKQVQIRFIENGTVTDN